MAKQQSSVLERQRVDVSEPKRYKVYIHNDDFTPMDFVVRLLITVFYKNKEEAERLMLKVHHSDKAVVAFVMFQTLQERYKSITFTPSTDPLIQREMEIIEEKRKQKEQ